MHKTLLIFRHEFLKTIKRAGFIIMTLALPVLVLLGIAIYHIVVATAKPAETANVGYVDMAGGFSRAVDYAYVNLVRFQTAQEATKALVAKDISEYFVIPRDFLSSGRIDLYTIKTEVAPPGPVAAAIKSFTTDNLLAGKVPGDIITRVEAPLNVTITTLTSAGEVAPQQGGLLNFIVPGIFGLLLGLSLVFNATYVVQSLGEEKENRLLEVLLSSVSPQQLLTGKILGLGAAGLLQVVVWVISLPLLLNLVKVTIGGIIGTLHVPLSFWFLGVIYFILGYFLSAVLSAAVAAITSTVQEAQSLAATYTMSNIAPLWFVSLLTIFPNSPVWTVFTIFPFTAPVLTMLRLGLTGVPAWQMAASIALLLLCILGGLLLDAKIVRAYMLMYGKRPRLKDIVRSLRSR